jgi:hypothetical protein
MNYWLDIVPDNVATLDHAFRDKTRAEQYLYSCYSYLPNCGREYSLAHFDDFIWTNARYGTGIDSWNYLILRDRNNADNPLLNYWSGGNGGSNLFEGIRDCNIFLERIDEPVDLQKFEKSR